MIGNISSLSLLVDILAFLFTYTSLAKSISLRIRCLVVADPNRIGKSVNGAKRKRIDFSKNFIDSFVFSSTVSHLLTKTTNPFLFF